MAQITITAENTFTPPKDVRANRKFNLSIWGTFVATVTVQRSFDGNETWKDVETFKIPGEWTGCDGEQLYYRVGVKTGDYTSGTVNIRFDHDWIPK